jgi:transposase-like protein
MEKEKRKALIKELIKEYDLKDTTDISTMLKELTSSTIEEILNAEMDETLGYERYDQENKHTENSRNGHSSKTLRSEQGEMEIQIPRDRNGDFEPQVIKKYQKDIGTIEQQIITLYAKGMSNREIEDFIKNLYGAEISPSLISRITDRILPEIREWQSRPLSRLYAMVYLDAIHYHVRSEGMVVNKAVYIAIGIDLNGIKDVLGLYIGEVESSKFWLQMLNELKNRGVEDVLICSVDGLPGFSKAIETVFPKTIVQRCIVHQIRSSTRYVSYKDIKEFTKDLKSIYQAATLDLAEQALGRVETKWKSKYPSSLKSWRDNWVELTAYFAYPVAIRKMIYTTNSIENFNRQLRKVTKTKSSYPTDDALLKSLYLAILDITKKWSSKPFNWMEIANQLMIFFEGRVDINDMIV